VFRLQILVDAVSIGDFISIDLLYLLGPFICVSIVLILLKMRRSRGVCFRWASKLI
jgi:hypothetical protein